MINSQILYFIETSQLKEQIFNSYMQDAVNLYNEDFKADAIKQWDRQEGLVPDYGTFLMIYLHGKWLEMVRDN